MNKTATISTMPEQLDMQAKRELLRDMLKANREQYRQAMRLNETIAFLKEILGPAEKEHEFTLSDMGVCRFRNVLEHMKLQAEAAACGGIYPYQLEKLTRMRVEDDKSGEGADE